MAQQGAEPATTSTKPDGPTTPASSWTTSTTGNATDDATSRMEGAHIAPGFTAAPSMRVRYDYRGRPMGAPTHRPTSRSSAPALSPTPPVQSNADAGATNASAGAVPAEATPTAATPTSTPAPVAKPSSLKSSATSTSAPTPKAAPAKKPAPAAKKKQSNGWGDTSNSGW
ncbi:hypothetical protein [Hymenobacter cavernae]|uniref:hypothetical protein n=1 Tax=Hymenobacter cavernae TaxID=2044852 RepID=UPI00166E3BA2|nr:hypothetical protein [Hymenobacter cavernae]